MFRLNFGLLAEYLTIFLYKICFYQILHHRLRSPVGEIDLVAVRGHQLVFIEVKARRSNFQDCPLRNNQQARIKRAAELFLSRNLKYQKYNVRFDLVIIKPYKLPEIIKNAW